MLSNSIDQNSRRKWLLKNADWQLFRDSLTFNDDLTDNPDTDINDINKYQINQGGWSYQCSEFILPKTRPNLLIFTFIYSLRTNAII